MDRDKAVMKKLKISIPYNWKMAASFLASNAMQHTASLVYFVACVQCELGFKCIELEAREDTAITT